MHKLQQLVDPRIDLFARPLADFQAERDVSRDGHVLERRVVLEHEADVALLRRKVRGLDSLDVDGPGVRGLQARDDAQQRGLAAARRPQERGQATGGDLEGHVVEGDE